MKKILCDVLVIGSGGAGIRTAIELHDNNVDVLVVGKCKRREAHTIMATGGINASLGNMDAKDSWQLHAADTIRDGGMINDSEAVSLLCKDAPRAVLELAKWGVKFNKEANGKISQRFFGAATYRRACFVGDHTGKDILNILIDQFSQRKIRMKSETYIFSLLTSGNVVNGALGLEMKTGNVVVFHSRVVVLATGGHSRMYKRSSSHFWENNGDGIALGASVGAKFVDMEMFQFHPTGMLYPRKAEGVLVTEAVRGEGGILLNAKGERFMEKYDPERKELSARDVVAKAIWSEVHAGKGTKHGGVWLDISHRKKSYILKRLPKMYKQFKQYGIDISKDKMEVGPTAHYSMGGLLVDHKTGKTSVSNLYAVGEVTGGVHGGNRLGGNSLAEIVVFGRSTGKQIVKDLKRIKLLALDEKLIGLKSKKFDSLRSSQGVNPITVKKDIQKMMWEYAGVVRSEKLLKGALREIKKYSKLKFSFSLSRKMNEKLIAAMDIKNMLPTCEMIVTAALFRTESRAAHQRVDYPKTLRKWEKNIVITPGKTLKLSTKKLKPVPKGVYKFFSEKARYHLLE